MSKRVSKKATKKVAKRITKKPVNRVAKKRTRKAKPKAAPRGMGKLTARLPNWAQVGLEYFKQFAWRAALIMAVALLGFTVYLDIQIVKTKFLSKNLKGKNGRCLHMFIRGH